MKPDFIFDKAVVSKQDKVREPLHTLQLSAANKENLVRVGKSLSHVKQHKETRTESVTPEKVRTKSLKRKRVTFKDKAVQAAAAGEKTKLEAEDLTTAHLGEKYWESLAERRRIALADALEENRSLWCRTKRLQEHIGRLEEESRLQKEMLDETRTFVKVLQTMLEDDGNGINNSLDDSVL